MSCFYREACLTASDWKSTEEIAKEGGRVDLRYLPVVSIDPPGCKAARSSLDTFLSLWMYLIAITFNRTSMMCCTVFAFRTVGWKLEYISQVRHYLFSLVVWVPCSTQPVSEM